MDSVELSSGVNVLTLKVLLVDPQLIGHLRTQINCKKNNHALTILMFPLQVFF